MIQNDVFVQISNDIINNKYDFLNLDKVDVDHILYIAQGFDHYKNLVLVGFGASLLNTRAILSSISKTSKNFIYIDSLASDYIDQKLSNIDLSETVFFLVSKSGNTSEVYHIAKYIYDQYSPDPPNINVVCRKSDNLLFNFAKTISANYIEHEQVISGRFGIIQPTALLISSILGVDISKFVKSAKLCIANFLSDGANGANSKAINQANWYLENYNQGKSILVIFNYINQMDGLCRYKQQIIAESLGKGGFGITPIVSYGSFDEHSQLQLYLDGPDDKFYEIYSLSNIRDFDRNRATLDQQIYNHCTNTYHSLLNHSRAAQIISRKFLDETIIANEIIHIMITIIAIAKTQSHNPFDQPMIDQIKSKLNNSKTYKTHLLCHIDN
ncbi:MAG: hypothetical protein AB8B67_05090 [Rickettsiaceae bacterium]